MDTILETLVQTIRDQQQKLDTIAQKLQSLNIGGGGGGNATISDYQSGKTYERNTLVVDTGTETVYRVLGHYVSIDVETDIQNGNLKLVGWENSIVAFADPPTQRQIEALPENTLVVVYSKSDDPYHPQSN